MIEYNQLTSFNHLEIFKHRYLKQQFDLREQNAPFTVFHTCIEDPDKSIQLIYDNVSYPVNQEVIFDDLKKNTYIERVKMYVEVFDFLEELNHKKKVI